MCLLSYFFTMMDSCPNWTIHQTNPSLFKLPWSLCVITTIKKITKILTYYWFWRWNDWMFFKESSWDESRWWISVSSDTGQCVIQDHVFSACPMTVIVCNGNHSAWLLYLSARFCGPEISTAECLIPLRLSVIWNFMASSFLKFSLLSVYQNLKILHLLILFCLPFIFL